MAMQAARVASQPAGRHRRHADDGADGALRDALAGRSAPCATRRCRPRRGPHRRRRRGRRRHWAAVRPSVPLPHGRMQGAQQSRRRRTVAAERWPAEPASGCGAPAAATATTAASAAATASAAAAAAAAGGNGSSQGAGNDVAAATGATRVARRSGARCSTWATRAMLARSPATQQRRIDMVPSLRRQLKRLRAPLPTPMAVEPDAPRASARPKPLHDAVRDAWPAFRASTRFRLVFGHATCPPSPLGPSCWPHWPQRRDRNHRPQRRRRRRRHTCRPPPCGMADDAPAHGAVSLDGSRAWPGHYLLG